MATANDVLDIALGEVGYKAASDPEAGSKYGRWMADLTGEEWLRGSSTSIWWCTMFVSWCLAQAGQGCTGFPSYNTDVVLGKGPQLVYREDAQPGDIIIWDWDSNGATDHIGFVYKHEPGSFGSLTTIEGNYQNSVAIVDRSDVWSLVSAVIRPDYETVSRGLDVDGYWGEATTSALQAYLGCTVDGEVWHQVEANVKANPALTSGWMCDDTGKGSPCVKALQAYIGMGEGARDGIIGPDTIAHLQGHFGTVKDGTLSAPSPCVMQLQKALNTGTL